MQHWFTVLVHLLYKYDSLFNGNTASYIPPQNYGSKTESGLRREAQTTEVSSAIIGGSNASINEFPFQVSLRRASTGNHTCSGSIITIRHVLTAAHCVLEEELFVVVGTDKLNNGGTKYSVYETTTHHGYNPEKHLRHDIAIIQTETEIKLGPTVVVASMPNDYIVDGSKVFASGWGVTKSESLVLPNQLQKIILPVIHQTTCSALLNITILEDQICAGGIKGHGACRGDSGGPLSINGTVIGLASFVAMPCGGTGKPDVFTRVYYYKSWIESHANITNILQ